MKTVIMLDSTVNVTPGLESRFSWVPLTVRFGDEEFVDGVTIQNDAFYEKLASSPVLPTTSQAMPYQFTKAFEEATKDGKKAVLITVSSSLSGTFQSAMLAARDFEGQVYVVDSKSVTIGAGILAEYALALSDNGIPAEEIFETLIEERNEIRIFGVLDTLEYLKKGGRISKAACVAGSLLSIKPVACIQNGAIEVVAKARGMKQGLSLLKKEIE
ncbi:MAG: DegV family protein, partial [Clostridia bacterium]|nr:DegV family protein [Clostridia bacterium]